MAEYGNQNELFSKSITLSYVFMVFLIAGIGYLNFMVKSMWNNLLTAYGQGSLLLCAGAILFLSLAPPLLFLKYYKATGISFGIGVMSYTASIGLAALNNGAQMTVEAKSPLILLILGILSGLIIIITAIKMDSERAPLLATLATILLFATWFYHGYLIYEHFDQYDTYGILRGALIEATRNGFREPLYLLLGGPFAPLVLILGIILGIGIIRGHDPNESRFLTTISFLGSILVILGSFLGSYMNIVSLLSTLNDFLGSNLLEATSFIMLSILLFAITSLVATFNIFGSISEFIPEEAPEIRPREKVGVMVKSKEEEEGEEIEEISLEDFDLEL